MKSVLLSLAFVAWTTRVVFAVCTPGTNWTTSWTDPNGQTVYSLEAPCKAYIGVPFDIVATVTDAAYPASNVGGLWAIKDNGATIDSGGIFGITLSGGQWQKVITRTYSGAPIDHTIEFTFTDYGAGAGAHSFAGSTIGSLTVDPYAALLPQTGQTSCWDSAGNVIQCTDPLAAGQDGAVRAGEPWPEPRFVDNGNGTITDNLTGLVWLSDAGCFAAQTWKSGLVSANTLASGSCGLSDGSVAGDWRLPNDIELESLVNREQENSAVWLNSQGFSGVQASRHWSANTFVGSPDYAWDINLYDGHVSLGAKATPGNILPVRRMPAGASIVSLPKTGQTGCWDSAGKAIPCTDPLGIEQDGAVGAGTAWPAPRFVDNGDGTITDSLTGLVWLKDTKCFGEQAWTKALDSATQLANGSCGLKDSSVAGDWRLPNVKELRSITNRQSETYTWLNSQGFFGVLSGVYWSASTDAYNPVYALGIMLGKESVLAYDKKTIASVWPVRGGTVNPPPPPAIYALSVTTSGSGTVTSDPAGIDCGETCSADFDETAVVTLAATANAGYVFTGWSGACSGTGDCAVTMEEAKSVTASFGIPCTPPGTLSLPATSTTGTYQLSWLKSYVTGEASYQVEESSNGGADWVTVANNLTANYLNLSGKASGSYLYRVKTKKAGYVDSLWKQKGPIVVTVTCGAPGAIYVPASSTTGKYRISWMRSATPGVVYQLEESSNGGGSWTAAGTDLATTYKDLPIRTAGSYLYRVKATKAGAADSAWRTAGAATVVY